MARIRSIHYDACKSEKLSACSAEAERCYWRLQPHCDDDGRAEDDTRVLRSAMFPVNEPPLPADLVDGWLAELHDAGLIVRYQVEGRRYLAVTRWHDYQHPNRKTDSKFPPPPDSAVTTHGSCSELAVSVQGVESAGVGEGEGVAHAEDRRRGSRIPEDFPLTADLEGWARQRCPGIDVVLQHERFVNHWQTATRNATKRDWVKAWHNWMLGEYDRLPAGRRGPRPCDGPIGLVLPPSRVETCPECESSVLACQCARTA